MVLQMARPWKHPKTGVYYLRKRVPSDVLTLVKRRVEKRSLGTKDPAEARRLHAEALVGLEARWQNLRAGLVRPTPVQIASMAGDFYRSYIADGEEGRIPFFGAIHLNYDAHRRVENRDDPTVRAKFRESFGKIIDAYLDARGLRIHPNYLDSFEFVVAQALRDGTAKGLHMQYVGDFSPDPAALRYPPPCDIRQVEPKARPSNTAALSVVESFEGYAKASKLAQSTRKRWGLSMGNLRKHLGHDDLRRIATSDVADWIAALRADGLSERTIRDVHLAALKAMMSWLVGERRLSENPASGFRIKVPKSETLRGKGLTDAEAKAILTITLELPSGKLGPKHAAARRWIPWLCAYTGARVNELTQLRHQDIVEISGVPCIWITPEAGSVKTGRYRNVPIHPHLIEQGFLTFARRRTSGPLFYDPRPEGEGSAVTPPYKKLGERLARWVRSTAKVDDPRVDPFHGWRHRFKTVARAAGVPSDVMDAIQGHAPRTEGEAYGEFPVEMLRRGIEVIPRYETG